MRPEPTQIDTYYCCPRCEQSTIKRNILNSLTNVEESMHSLKNVF